MIELSLKQPGKSLECGDELHMVKQLDQEARVYTKYLIKQAPSPYVIEKYRQAHLRSPNVHQALENPFNELLVKLSSKGPFWARLVDSYATFFLRNALVRKKIILLMAILESSAPTYQAFESPESKNPLVIIVLLGLRGAGFVFSLFIALLIFLPLRLLYPHKRKMSFESRSR